ncbi:MAG TPA: rod-binding protein [Gemmatimonadaceae bacterium]
MIGIGAQPGSPATGALDPAAGARDARDAKLHKVSHDLEGVFVQQMYKSMRSTVPTGGLFDGGSAEEMFTGLMDEHMAADTPQEWKHGLSESIYRQLKNAVNAQGSALPPESSATMSTGVDKK